jgi:YidC/Oxa1 family membrane protein insertase
MAVTSYMLILAWNDDYKSKPAANEPIITDAVQEGGGSELPIGGDIDDTTGSVGVDELPSVTPETTVSEVNAPVLPDGRVIKVSTDVLDIWINTVGGDITRIDLPKYPQDIDSPDIPFILVDPRNSYVAQSGLIGANGPDAKKGRTHYEVSAESFELRPDENELTVDMRYTDDTGVVITKRFHLKRDSYLVEVEFLIENRTKHSWSANIFAQIKRDGQSPSIADSNSMGLQPFVGGATFSQEAPYHKLEFEDLLEEPFKEKVQGGYIAMVQHYFVSAWVPPAEFTYAYQARKVQGKDRYLMGFTGPTIQVAPGDSAATSILLYSGPKKQYLLRELAKGLDLTVDYGFLWWIAQPLFSLLDFIHGLVGNWAVAIILLTVIVKMLLYPLSAASFKSMAKMRKLQPEMQRLKERHGDDRQKFSQAMMDLYKKEGANPLGGCLPMLLQMPVFLALYWTLMESVELRQAPFALWIKDLSIMDPYFVLPILMGISMFLTQMMQPEPPDPVQAKVMKLMPVMFTFFFLWFPSGLVLYWLVNNIISVLQQWYVTRQIDKAST